MDSSPNKAIRGFLLLVRLVLGGVFVYAAWIKLREPWLLFAMSIDAYKVVPQWTAELVARTLPWLELALGLVLLSGFFRRVSSVSAAALLTGFFALMVRAYIRGETIDCGCFGPGEAISPLTLLRDGSLLLGAILLAVAAFRARRKPFEPPRVAGGTLVAAHAGESGDRPA